MCGIAGIVAPANDGHRSALERMVNALRHRGPDGVGSYYFPDCLLGHTRLSIVDLTTGDQPMLADDGQIAITFNGEIYGYREIRRGLQDEYQFRTSSDTEVILALYERYSADMFRHLPGMFAFAIWDERERALLAARDRFGEKPFYYAWGRNGEFLFASEIKALLASGLVKPRLDKKALAHYLRRLYIHPHQTIYSNVFTLPPAHRLVLKDGRIEIAKYWMLPPMSEPLSEQEAIAEFKRLFEQAVERQLVADVPVGAFLSGGLDSSSVVAAASRNHPRLRTFSFGFGQSRSELPFARSIAELYGTDHVELEDRHEEIAELLLKMARVYDEPFADSSNIPTYLISREARRFGKVVLTGDGGDELLGGYDFWYRPLWNMERTKPQLAKLAKALDLAGRVSYKVGLPVHSGWQATVQGAKLRREHASIARAHFMQNTYFNDAELEQLGLRASEELAGLDEVKPYAGTVDAAMRMDLLDYMPGDILVKTDRASMAHGLELRAPFLDLDFASFCISLPARLKITERQDKWILRQCYSARWSEAVRQRGKQGFGAPVEDWLKLPSVARLKDRVLNDPDHSLFSVIPFGASRWFAQKGNYQTWALLTLGLWLEQGGEDSL